MTRSLPVRFSSLNRLVSAQTDQKGGGQYSETYAYDPVGNLVNKGDDCYGYWQEDCGVPGESAPREMKPHAVTHLNGVQKFWYDANGNMTRRIEGSVTYEQTFNSENRLSSVAVGGSTTTFIYDADGNRIQTIEPDGTTTTYPFPGYEEVAHNGAVTRRTTYSLGGQAVALRVQGPGSENNLYYLITDRLGSTRLVLSEGGSAVPGSTARYLPFGDWRTEPTANLTDRGFTGHMQENLGSNDLGLIYMRARFFVPALGRFASADTIVPNLTNPQQYNRYTYSLNSPLVFVDPSGHCTQYAGVNDAELSACLEAWNSLGNSYLELWQLGGMESYPDELMNDLLQNGTTDQIQTLLETMHTSASAFREHKWNEMHTGCSPTWGDGEKCAPDGGWPNHYPMSDEEKAELIAKGIKFGVTFPLNFVLGKGVKLAVSNIIDDPIYAFAASLIIRGVVINRTTSKIYGYLPFSCVNIR